MITRFVDIESGAPVYINPDSVMSVRPDPLDPDHLSVIKLKDGESMRVKGEHRDVADKLGRAA